MNILKINKKAQYVEQITGLAIALVGLALVLVIGFLILTEAKVQSVSSDDTLVSTNNETFTAWTVNVNKALGRTPNSMETTCTEIRNGTAGATTILPTSDYTCEFQGLTITDAKANDTLLVTYTSKNRSYSYNGSIDTQQALDQIPGWLGIIVIVTIGSIIIGLVMYVQKKI